MINLKTLRVSLKTVKIRSLDKGDILIPVGAVEKNIYFIRKGLIRSYYTNDMEDEITFQLYPEYNVVSNIHSLLFNEPSQFSYQALEATKVYSIDHDTYFELVAKEPKLTAINRKFLGKKAMRQAFQRVESFVFLSPEERYKKYVKEHPNVVNRAPDKYIAHVLGITPVSLSRIRNRIASRKN